MYNDVTNMQGKEQSEDSFVVVYHNDADGAASAYIVGEALNISNSNNVKFVPYDHAKRKCVEAEIIGSLQENTKLFFVDVSPKKDFLDELMSPDQHGQNKLKSVSIIDHHASAAKDLADYLYKAPSANDDNIAPKLDIEIDPDCSSATKMVWNRFKTSEDAAMPDWVKIIDMLDRNNLSLQKEFAAAAYVDTKRVDGSPEEAMKSIKSLTKLSFDFMARSGYPIIRAQKETIKQLIRCAHVVDIEVLPNKTMQVPMVTADVRNYGRQIDKYLNLLGKIKGQGLSFAWYQKSTGEVNVSIRSNGTPDAGEVAKHICDTVKGSEGGGHNNSAAVTMPSLSSFNRFVEKSSDRKYKGAESANKGRIISINSQPRRRLEAPKALNRSDRSVNIAFI